jgi:hypothetical protein
MLSKLNNIKPAVKFKISIGQPPGQDGYEWTPILNLKVSSSCRRGGLSKRIQVRSYQNWLSCTVTEKTTLAL